MDMAVPYRPCTDIPGLKAVTFLGNPEAASVRRRSIHSVRTSTAA